MLKDSHFIHPCVHSFNKHTLSTYVVLTTVLSAGNTLLSETDTVPTHGVHV